MHGRWPRGRHPVICSLPRADGVACGRPEGADRPCATLRAGPEPRTGPPATPNARPADAERSTHADRSHRAVPADDEGRSPGSARVRGGTNRQEVAHHAVRLHAATARGRSPLRPPDPPLEPQDAPVHLRGAQRDPHHRPGPDGPAPGRRARGRPGDRRARRAGAVRRHEEAGPGADHRGGDTRQPAVRQQALARRDAHQLHDDQEAHRPARAARGAPVRPATSSG